MKETDDSALAERANNLLDRLADQFKAAQDRIAALENALRHCELLAFTGTQTAVTRGDDDGDRRAAFFRDVRRTALDALDASAVHVTTLALCESESLVLHPDQLYRFEVRPGCARREELAKIGGPT